MNNSIYARSPGPLRCINPSLVDQEPPTNPRTTPLNYQTLQSNKPISQAHSVEDNQTIIQFNEAYQEDNQIRQSDNQLDIPLVSSRIIQCLDSATKSGFKINSGCRDKNPNLPPVKVNKRDYVFFPKTTHCPFHVVYVKNKTLFTINSKIKPDGRSRMAYKIESGTAKLY